MDYYINLWYTKNTKEINKNIVLVMLGLEKEELLDLSKKDRMVLRYMSKLDKVNENPEFREYMSYEEDQRKIVNSLVSEGIEKGIEQGIETLIKTMLNNHVSVEEISRITNIEEDKIIKIRDAK